MQPFTGSARTSRAQHAGSARALPMYRVSENSSRCRSGLIPTGWFQARPVVCDRDGRGVSSPVMAGREISAEEQRAGDAVASALDGKLIPRDVEGAPELTYDFDVVLPGHRTVALEVTSSADEMVLSLLAQAYKRRWNVPGLENDWQVGVAHPVGGSSVAMNRVRKEIGPVLAVFEQNGVTEIGSVSPVRRRTPDDAYAEVTEAARRMFGLGVLLARLVAPKRDPLAAVLISVHGSAVGNAQEINRLVEAAATSNSEKLAAASADERHLFVWIHPSTPNAELAMYTGSVPPAPPAVPDVIDACWASTWGPTSLGSEGIQRLIRTALGGPWLEVPSPETSRATQKTYRRVGARTGGSGTSARHTLRPCGDS